MIRVHKNGKGIWVSRGGGVLASFVTEGDRCGWDIGGENNHYHCNLIILQMSQILGSEL